MTREQMIDAAVRKWWLSNGVLAHLPFGSSSPKLLMLSCEKCHKGIRYTFRQLAQTFHVKQPRDNYGRFTSYPEGRC